MAVMRYTGAGGGDGAGTTKSVRYTQKQKDQLNNQNRPYSFMQYRTTSNTQSNAYNLEQQAYNQQKQQQQAWANTIQGIDRWAQGNNSQYQKNLAAYQQQQQQKQKQSTPAINTGTAWSTGAYNPPANYRETYANILMTQDEYIRRMNAWNKLYQSGYGDWLKSAANTPNQPHDITSQWGQNNPKPAGFLQTFDEWNKRNNVAPPGYMYIPYGSGYAKLNTASQTTTPTNNAGGGGYVDYGGYGGYGGGGGSGYQNLPDWWLNMTNWRI